MCSIERVFDSTTELSAVTDTNGVVHLTSEPTRPSHLDLLPTSFPGGSR